MFQKENHDKPG